jgi:NifB/MoaA-like Fe-S oxidoreductase
MLSNPTAPDILQQLRRLTDLRIQAHTQIVLCPGVNDGDHLARSIRDLCELYPTVQTISVVPVGASPKLEDWSLQRDGIPLVRPTPESAREVLAVLAPFQKEFRKRFGATIVQCSDEFYVTADAPIPGRIAYDGFPQYENGIGMVRTMLDDWSRAKRKAHPGLASGKSVVIGTAALIAPKLSRVASEAAEVTGASITVRGVTNTVFGERVNVSGLICGKDYVEQLSTETPDLFILPRPSLDYFGEKFLDSMTVDEAEQRLGAPLAFASVWSDVLEILRDGPRRPGRNDATNGAMWSEPPA